MPKLIVVPNGSIKSIIAYLGSIQIDTNRLDSWFLRFLGHPQMGWIDLGETQIKKADLLYKITRSKSALVSITLIPGETTYFFFEEIARVLQIPKETLWREYVGMVECEEGNFIPQTYRVPYGIGAKDLLEHLLSYSQKQYITIARDFGLSIDSLQWKKTLSKASIIQKESAGIDEMPLISAVIDNRIARGMALQMDGSLNYGKYSHSKVTPQRIREDQSPYNTYKHKGISACPSGSVSVESIRAALKPADVPYLYFVRNKEGKHSFSTSYQEHLKNFQK
ncbi:endolytic transglycosylase MltG [Helicobacter enhydrae]|uniref:endolytic transglycosylase MltG n=1 Tax=Helicobacter enhydrae TaxID=222136 RepID=UPI0019004B5C|nr:endolytic transglycosylase MltG [Helicobacter enhydrae]